jgi:molecular chaperone Hsp33
MSDMLWRGTAWDDQFRVLAVESTATVQAARDLHDLSPLATILMGQMVSAVALLSLDLKVPASDVSLKVSSNGILSGGMVICTQDGHVRGFLDQPHVFLENAPDNYSIARNLGQGTLSVIKKYPARSPWIGTIALEPGEIAENVARYYRDSEQIPTLVNLGVLFDREAQIRAAGGFVVQQLPAADPRIVDNVLKNLNATPNISDLMDMGMGVSDILCNFIFKGGQLSLNEAGNLFYKCNCSRERFSDALKLLGKDELSSLTDGIAPECHFCGKIYDFTTEDIKELIGSMDNPK